jgi:hypothetical protein
MPYEFLHNNHQVKEYVISGKRMPKAPECSDEMYKLMMDCWEDDPSKRPTFVEILGKLEKMSGLSGQNKLEINTVSDPGIYNVPVNTVYN